jgi:hypothetical protein
MELDKPCKKLTDVPPVVSEGQMEVMCVNCKFYYRGKCANTNRTAEHDVCPFDGKSLPLVSSSS